MFILYMVPYVLIGYDILKKALKGILNRQVFDENFLMAVATVGAIIIALIGDGDYTEAIAVMLDDEHKQTLETEARLAMLSQKGMQQCSQCSHKYTCGQTKNNDGSCQLFRTYI